MPGCTMRKAAGGFLTWGPRMAPGSTAGGLPPRSRSGPGTWSRSGVSRSLSATRKVGSVSLVLVARHGLTAATGTPLTGRTPGIPLDDRGRAQAAALAERLAPVRLDAIVSSPMERCVQTAEAIAAERAGPRVEI